MVIKLCDSKLFLLDKFWLGPPGGDDSIEISSLVMSKCINIRLEGSGTEIQRPYWDFRGPTSLAYGLRHGLKAEVSVSVLVLLTSEDGTYLVVR